MAYAKKPGGNYKTLRERDKKKNPNVSMTAGSPEEQAYMNRLKDDIMNANANYIKFYQDNPCDPDTERMDMMMRYRYMEMFRMCAMPLARGMRADSVLSAVGMYAGMTFLDKDFRKNAERSVANLLYPHVEKLASKYPDNSKLGQYRNKLLLSANGGKLPYTPDSAAVQQIAFMQKAYFDMRKPGADVNAISQQCDQAMATVVRLAGKDGISEEQINTSMRFMVGKLIEKNPGAITFFKETMQDGISKDDYHNEVYPVVGDDGKVHNVNKMVWRGGFTDGDGKAYEGGFHVNPPRSVDDYAKVFDSIYSNLYERAHADAAEDPSLDHYYKDIARGLKHLSEEDFQKFDMKDMDESFVKNVNRVVRDKVYEMTHSDDPEFEWYGKACKDCFSAMVMDGITPDEVDAVMHTSATDAAIRSQDFCGNTIIMSAKGDVLLQKEAEKKAQAKAQAKSKTKSNSRSKSKGSKNSKSQRRYQQAKDKFGFDLDDDENEIQDDTQFDDEGFPI